MKAFKLTKTVAAAVLALGAAVISTPNQAQAQSEPFIGQISVFGFTFCPRGWAAADGTLLAINSNQALFSLYGTYYGGDGRTTFALPDLRGRSIVHQGTGAGLSPYSIGQRGGTETHTMSVTEMPSHNHMVNANNGANGFADRLGPGNDFLGSPSYNDPTNPAEDIYIYSDQAPNQQMDPRMIANTGGGLSFNIRDPYLALTVCVALEGIFPSRS
ncbi:phage tail protein [Thalassovita sp.]|uniref:phage tail protein n=1 Tax=Thalassovita sp. TaxID=1979401 RepID=UPI003B59B26C